MKKIISKVFLPVFSIAFLFSSCLGDNENTFEQSRSFSYVTTNDSRVKVAATASGYIVTSSEIQSTSVVEGQCYYLSFKLSSESTVTGGAYNVELTSTPQLIKSSNFFNRTSPPSTLPAGTDSLYVTAFNVGNRSPYDYYGDRWLFGYTAQPKVDETPIATFYYDINNQVDKDGTEIITSGTGRENKMIIDVVFTKTNLNPGGVTQSTTAETVADLSQLRSTFDVNSSTESDIVKPDGVTEYVRVAVKFRYWAINPSTSQKEQYYIGTWTINDSNSTSAYYFLIKK